MLSEKSVGFPYDRCADRKGRVFLGGSFLRKKTLHGRTEASSDGAVIFQHFLSRDLSGGSGCDLSLNRMDEGEEKAWRAKFRKG